MKLRSYLILLVVAAVLPVVVFSGIIVYQAYRQEQENLEGRLAAHALRISAALDREFLVSIQSLKVLGASTRLDKGQLAEFYGDMKAALDEYSGVWQNLTLTDATGQQLINLRRPFGSSLPMSGNPAAIDQVRIKKQPMIADLSPGPVTGALGFVVHVPVIKEGQVKYLLNAIFYPGPLSDFLSKQQLPSGWIATIVDRNHTIAARTLDAKKYFGRPTSPAFAAHAKQYPEATWRGSTVDDTVVLAALDRSDFSGWTIVVASPIQAVEAPLKRALLLTGGGGVILLLLALALARVLGRRIADPVAALANAAERLGKGEAVPVLPCSIWEIDRVAGALEDAGTKRREVEAALRRAREDLEQKIDERTRELSQANIKLRDVDRLKSEFLANMSHELRTPLNGIIGFSQLMYDGKAGGALSAQHKEYVGDILQSGKHLLQLINDVLDLSKVEAGRMEVLKSTFTVDEVILEVVQNVAPLMSVKELKLVRDIPKDLPALTTDRRKLLQILINLVSNAVKFTDHGTVTIAARLCHAKNCGRKNPCSEKRDGIEGETEDTGLRIEDGHEISISKPALVIRRQVVEIGNRQSELNHWVEFSVADTGIGIRADDLPLLFQPFSQVDGSVRRRHEGTGLGLYLSQKLAELLGGRITVESEYGKGSTFTVVIPLDS